MNAQVTFHSHATLMTPERLVLRQGSWRRIPLAVRYGVLQRQNHAPVLLDGGWPRSHPGDGRAFRLYHRLMRATVHEDHAPDTVVPKPESIILTHLHADHVGALRRFPEIPAYASAAALKGLQLRHAVFRELLGPTARFHAFEDQPSVMLPHDLGHGHDILGDGSVLSVPLPGHAPGHCGLYLPGDPDILYAGDTQWLLRAILENRAPRGPARLVPSNLSAWADSSAKVAEFAKAGGRVVLAHEPET